MTTLSLAETAQLNQLIFIVFVVGVITGAICTGFMKNLIKLISMHFEMPRRIKTNDGYLYRFKRIYMSLDERNELMKKSFSKYRDEIL